MRVQIDISADNDAFVPDPVCEIARILEELAERLRNVGEVRDGVLRDLNGNTVGRVVVERD
jgi:hypothetical protein